MIKKLKKIKTGYWFLIVIVLGVLAILLFKRSTDNGLVTQIVTRTEVSDTLQLAGTIDVDRRVDLGFATSGRISDVLIQKGEQVERGQTIARIDQNQLQASLIQARANQVVTEVDTRSELDDSSTDLSTIEAQQNALVQGAFDAYLSGDLQAYLNKETGRNLTAPIITGTYLGSQEGEYILEMYSSGANSGYSFRLSGLESGTYSAELYQPGKVGSLGLYMQLRQGVNYNNTKWAILVPNVRSSTYISRKSAYENALAARDQVVTSARNSVNRVNATTFDTSRSEAQIQQARAQVNAVYAQLNDGKIVAPFDGIIARNDLEIGEIVSAFDPLVTVFGSNDRELKLNVPEIYINKIELADSVEITLDAYPEETFTGTVESIDILDTLVDGVPVYETVVVLNQEDPRIRVGMNAKARITADSKEDVLAIPQHYLLEKDGSFFVMLIDNNSNTAETKVEPGFEGNDGLVEIISGLSLGDEIVRPDGFSKDNS